MTPALLSRAADAIEASAALATPANQTQAGYWLRIALAAEDLAGASTSAQTSRNGYMLRTALALEAAAGLPGGTGVSYFPLLRRCVLAAEDLAGAATEGSWLLRLAVALEAGGASAPLLPTTVESSFVYKGETVNLSPASPVGYDVRGEPIVISNGSPVTVTFGTPSSVQASGQYSDATPYTDRVVHGATVNGGNRQWAPGGLLANNTVGATGQGYDSLGGKPTAADARPYDAALNLDGAISITSGSITKAISRDGQAGRSWPPIEGRQYIHRMFVVTVLESTPPADCFRPPVAPADKSMLVREAHVDLSFLPSLALPSGDVQPWVDAASLATQATVLGGGSLPLDVTFQTGGNWRAFMPLNDGLPEYGRDIGHEIAHAALGLCLNYSAAEKKDAAYALIRLGLDVYGRREEGGSFGWSGGGEQWRKFALVFAARALASSPYGAALAAAAGAANNAHFTEDKQMFVVGQTDVDTYHYQADARARTPYYGHLIGTAEWGEAGNLTGPNAQRSASNWNAWYRDNIVAGTLGQALAARLMGLDSVWDNPVLFDYFDRAWNMVKGGTFAAAFPAGGFNTRFEKRMWETYRDDSSAVAPARVAIEARDSLVWARFADCMDAANVPAPGDFVLKINGGTVALPAASVATTLSGATAVEPNAGTSFAVASAAGVVKGMLVSGAIAGKSDTMRVVDVSGTTIIVDSCITGSVPNGSAITFTTMQVSGNAVAFAAPQTILSTDTLTLAYTSGATPLRNARNVNAASWGDTAVTNLTGYVRDPVPAIAMMDNGDAANAKLEQGFGPGNGVKKILIAMKFKVDSTPVAADLLFRYDNNTRLYWASATTLRMIFQGSARFQHNITTTFPAGAGTYTVLQLIDWTNVAPGTAYLNGVAAAAAAAGDLTGTYSFNMGSAYPNDVGVLANTDNTNRVDGGLEWMWMHWGDASWTPPDITNSTVRDLFTTAAIGGNGEAPMGSPPNIFLPGYLPEINGDGLYNRGLLTGKVLLPVTGTWA